MGAWGVRALENDDAMDFAGELDGDTDLAKVRAALGDLEAAKASGGYLDCYFTNRALACAEILAALASGDKTSLDPSTSDYIAKIAERPSPDDIARARAAVALLRNEGETKDLFEESEAFEEWKAEMSSLAARLAVC